MTSRNRALLQRLSAGILAATLATSAHAAVARADVSAPQGFEGVFTLVNASVVELHIDTKGESGQVCSAFAVDIAPGIVVTANCTASESSHISALLPSGAQADAEFWGRDESSGLAVFHISAKLPPLRWASGPPRNGEQVAVVSYAWNMGPLITTGIVAGQILRLDRYPAGVIFVDVPIFRGTAGAPMTNLAGEVVGIICGIYGNATEINRGFGLAMPAADVRRVVQKILDARTQH